MGEGQGGSPVLTCPVPVPALHSSPPLRLILEDMRRCHSNPPFNSGVSICILPHLVAARQAGPGIFIALEETLFVVTEGTLPLAKQVALG